MIKRIKSILCGEVVLLSHIQCQTIQVKLGEAVIVNDMRFLPGVYPNSIPITIKINGK